MVNDGYYMVNDQWLMMVNSAIHIVVSDPKNSFHVIDYKLVGGWPTPLKNDGVSNSWDDDIPNMMGKS